MPTRVHAIVLVSKLHKPTLRALAFAKATRPNVLEAVYVASDRKATKALVARVGRAQPRRPAQGPVLALPRDRPADRRLRHPDPQGQPARRRRGLHPGVRRGPVVGAVAAQPDRAAAQGPAAVHARRDGDLGALPAAVVADRPASATSARRRVQAGDLRRGRVGGDRDSRPGDPAGDRRPRARARGRVPGRASGHGRGRAGRPRRPLRGPAAPDGRVVFVRHALPGERVVVEVTEGTDGDRFWRGDAVEVLERVARPGRPRLARTPGPAAAAAATSSTSTLGRAARAQGRRWSREQLQRLAGLDRDGRRRSRCPATTTACAGAPGPASPGRPRRRAGRCASTARTTWSRSTTA